MLILLVILFVILALVLTIGVVPVLTGAGWLLLALIGLVIILLCLQWVFSEIADDFRPVPDPYKNAPKPGDPDYLDWANREGKYAPGYRPPKPKPKPPTTNGVTGRTPRPLKGDDDYLDWANREGAYEDD